MKRLFIESEALDHSEVRRAQRNIRRYLESSIPLYDNTNVNIFDEMVDFAWHEPQIAWEAVKRADEIYADSSLTSLSGIGSYTGSPVVMDVMMQRAIEENITGKSIFFLRDYDYIEWDNIDMDLIDKAFRKNYLYTLEENGFEQVDIDKLIRKYK